MTDFTTRLNQAMELRNIKQIDFVKAAQDHGVKLGRSHISQYVSGKTRPRRDIERFLAAVLRVNADWLAGESVPFDDDPETFAKIEHVSPDADFEHIKRVEQNSSIQNSEHIEHNNELAEIEQEQDMEAAANNNVQDPSFPDVPSSVTSEPMNIGSRRVFTKSHKLDNVLYDVRGPVVNEAARMEAAGMHVMKLNIGNPAPFGFRTPDEVVYDMAQQLTDTEGYSASKGLFSARKAIMQYAQLKNLPNVGVEDIYTGNGVSELINLSMSALLDDGDEVLLPAPDYPLWTACVTLAGGKPVHYVCDEQSEWYPDIDDMRAKITDRTKAIVIINPNNPTGALYPTEVLQQIVELARQHQLMIFSDEIYDRLVMDGLTHTSIASLAPDLFCVTYSGLSKSHMIAGYRIGWMILSGNKSIAKDYIEGLDMLTNMRICSNVPAQSIVQTALGGHQSVNDYLVPGAVYTNSVNTSTTR
nr:aminotransferase class I/II-fold pyridoxal phosphate-dependent enzyme [Bifidobacterium animalis]